MLRSAIPVCGESYASNFTFWDSRGPYWVKDTKEAKITPPKPAQKPVFRSLYLLR
jgi:hypothetical protein